jgi:choline dehydrogenase-like flavoprotein
MLTDTAVAPVGVIAGRLAENPDVTILVVEAGQHNEKLENTQMVGGSAISDSALMDPFISLPCRGSKGFDSELDWNIVTEPPWVNNRRVKLSRGRP